MVFSHAGLTHLKVHFEIRMNAPRAEPGKIKNLGLVQTGMKE